MTRTVFVEGACLGEFTSQIMVWVRYATHSNMQADGCVCSPKRRNPDAILPSAVIFQHLMSERLRILNIVGARPNLPKIAPLIREMQRHPDIEPILVHTGQHYDEKLSDIFFRQMGIPSPQVNLEVGSGTHASQTAEILKRIEPVLLERKPHLVLVVGDVNSTFAVSLAAAKIGIRVAHV